MKTLLIFSVLAMQPAANPSGPLPLTDTHKRDLSCVAALAIVASEQEKGVESALDYPFLSERGRIYAGNVGQRVIAETGQSKEQVKQVILAAVSSLQVSANANEPDAILSREVQKCLPLLDAELPPKPKPTLNQCAAMLELAYREVYGREGLSKTAQDLKTLAAVLDNRAREKMKAAGYSGNESDIVLTQLREEMLADAKVNEASGKGSDLDFDHCFALAAPEDKNRKFEH